MKLWTFYYINKDMLNKDGVYETGYDLLAFTNNKEYALMFIETRDASKFIIRKHKVTKEEYAEYANEHLGKKLDLYKVSIRDNGKHTTEGVIPVDILMTYDEHTYIDEPAFIVEDPGFWDGAAFPFIFKDKYETLKDACSAGRMVLNISNYLSSSKICSIWILFIHSFSMKTKMIMKHLISHSIRLLYY